MMRSFHQSVRTHQVDEMRDIERETAGVDGAIKFRSAMAEMLEVLDLANRGLCGTIFAI